MCKRFVSITYSSTLTDDTDTDADAAQLRKNDISPNMSPTPRVAITVDRAAIDADSDRTGDDDVVAVVLPPLLAPPPSPVIFSTRQAPRPIWYKPVCISPSRIMYEPCLSVINLAPTSTSSQSSLLSTSLSCEMTAAAPHESRLLSRFTEPCFCSGAGLSACDLPPAFTEPSPRRIELDAMPRPPPANFSLPPLLPPAVPAAASAAAAAATSSSRCSRARRNKFLASFTTSSAAFALSNVYLDVTAPTTILIRFLLDLDTAIETTTANGITFLVVRPNTLA
mmetsp:Transcript_54302/g.133106  ORF Transcript_54302/g.133106 Transcript_54302/m.133106 type:complete len:281 (-) Transcript_54302:301-1143(-)